MKCSGKLCLMIILKVEKQGLTPSLESEVLEKP